MNVGENHRTFVSLWFESVKKMSFIRYAKTIEPLSMKVCHVLLCRYTYRWNVVKFHGFPLIKFTRFVKEISSLRLTLTIDTIKVEGVIFIDFSRCESRVGQANF